MKLKILLLYDRIYPDYLGGVEHRNLELALALARRGHDVTLAGWANESRQLHPGVSVLSLGGPDEFYSVEGKRKVSNALRIAAAAARLDLRPYDVVETANIPYTHILPLAARARWRGKPLVVTWYEYWGRYWRDYVGWTWPAYATVEWCMAQLADVVVASSGLTQARLARRRIRRGGVGLLPCGVDTRRIREAATHAGKEASDGVPLVYAGRLQREKRVDLLLAAVRCMVDGGAQGPLLDVIGDGPEAEALRRLTDELGIADRVVFHGRLETNEDVWRRFGGARVAVQPSSREGFGLFPLEAMAAGLPVVYCHSSESALPELVRHGREGLATEPEPAALAASLERLMAGPDDWQSYSQAALERAEEYDWSVIAKRTEAVFEAALGDRG